MSQRKNSLSFFFTLFSKRRWKLSCFCGSYHLVFMFWFFSSALFGRTLINVMLQKNCQEWTFQWCLNVFIFNILSKFLRDTFFLFVFMNLSAIYCSNSKHSLRMDSVELGELLFFPKGRVLFMYSIIYVWDSVIFSLWAASSRSVLEGIKAIFF